VEPDDPKREYLEEMKQGLQGFMSLLDDLKQFYKTPILHLADTDLNELVRASRPYVEQQLADRRIALELRLDPKLPALRCDAEKIHSVILNLLLNAVEAVGESGRILVETRTAEPGEGRTVILSVTDNGGGMAEGELPRIFHPFYSTKAGGSGLGLAIASNLVSAHGGKIEVESGVGQGATFTVTLQTSDPGRPTSDREAEFSQV